MSFFDTINRFAQNPVNINHSRSAFNLSHKVSTTFNSGYLIPLMCQEVLPGDTFKINFSSVNRMITPAVPVMDNAYFDVFAFWCPNRILTVHDKDWQKVCGENVNSYGIPSSEATLSSTGNTFTLSSSSYAIKPQSLGDYMTLPQGFYHSTQEFSRLPFNGYWEIWNEFFRSQQTQAPINWKSFTASTIRPYIYDSANLCQVNKLHDYFTSALPTPLYANNSVLIPMSGDADVITKSTSHNVSTALKWRVPNQSSDYTTNKAIGISSTGNTSNSSASFTTGDATLAPSNLYADLTNATQATINDLRQGFAIQRLLEKQNRSGNRYRETLFAFFGISIPDNTVQVPEYLGGKRVPLGMLQVVQTAQDSNSPLGTTGAFSNTSDSSDVFVKSFPEYGYVYVLCCVRTNQSYSQGISPMFIRNRRYDFYWPVFANLGEQAIKTTELYATNASNFDTVFGYKEAWAEYRYIPSKITGYLSANSGDNIASLWTYTNHFASAPVLNSDFLKQDKSQLGNTLAVTNSNYQFILDGWFNFTAWREMPYFSIPGLIDHN